MAQSQREFDLIVFGATGVTGQYVVEEVARSNINETVPFKWAIAGRSKDKLTHVLNEASNELSRDLTDIQMIEADVANYESLLSMCKRTKIIINCVGPYRFYGEPMVKACVESGTHHVDISGEPQYLESMVLSYNKKAEEKGIYIIGACGWDSIPADLGVTLLKKKFDGELCSVEGFMIPTAGPEGMKVNFGTFQSAIHGVAHWNELKTLRRRLNEEIFTKRPPLSKHRLKKRDVANGWCIPFPGSDKSIVYRSQLYNYMHNNERPIQYEPYIVFKSLWMIIGLLFVGSIFGIFASFKGGRYLLERYPGFFTFGMFNRGGPTREQVKQSKFKMIFAANGWKEKLNEPSDEPNSPPNKKVYAQMRGLDPAYGATSIFLVQSAITILKESDKMPKPGGVITTSAAFRNTNIFDRFHDTSFEIHESKL